MGEAVLTQVPLVSTDLLALALVGDSSGFLGHLLRCMAKADQHNLRRLALIFPGHARLYIVWMRAHGPRGGSPTLADVARQYLAELELTDLEKQALAVVADPRAVLLDLVEGGD